MATYDQKTGWGPSPQLPIAYNPTSTSSAAGAATRPWSLPTRRCNTVAVMVLFRGRIRRWREDKPGGPAVIDIPLELVAELGGRRQMRMAGSLNAVPFAGSTMLVAGGGFCVGVSRAALQAAGVSVGEEVAVQLERANGGPT
jgi:hypothetical protein